MINKQKWLPNPPDPYGFCWCDKRRNYDIFQANASPEAQMGGFKGTVCPTIPAQAVHRRAERKGLRIKGPQAEFNVKKDIEF